MKCFVALALCLQLWSSAEAQTQSCGHTMDPADIAILLDSTHSIKEENWPVMKQFMKDVADRVNYGPDGTRMGGIQWSRKSWEMMSLDQFSTKQSLFDALDQIPFRRGGGQLHKALDMLADQTLSRNVSRDVARIGILIIDEQSHQPELTQTAAQKVRAVGIKMIAIGVERRRFDFNELVGIAGNGSRVLVVDSIMDLDTSEFLDELMALICSDANSDVGASSPSGGQSGAPAPGTLKAPLGPPSTCGVPGFPDKAMDMFDFEGQDGGVLENNGCVFDASMPGHGQKIVAIYPEEWDSPKTTAVLNRYPSNSCILRPERCPDGWTIAFWMTVPTPPSYQAVQAVFGTQINFMKYTEGFKIWRTYFNKMRFDVLGLESNTRRGIALTLPGETSEPMSWTHFAFTYMNGLMEGFVNGKLATDVETDFQQNKGVVEECNNAIVFGADDLSPNFTYDSGAHIDDLYIYQRVLDEAEIQELMGKTN